MAMGSGESSELLAMWSREDSGMLGRTCRLTSAFANFPEPHIQSIDVDT